MVHTKGKRYCPRCEWCKEYVLPDDPRTYGICANTDTEVHYTHSCLCYNPLSPRALHLLDERNKLIFSRSTDE